MEVAEVEMKVEEQTDEEGAKDEEGVAVDVAIADKTIVHEVQVNRAIIPQPDMVMSFNAVGGQLPPEVQDAKKALELVL